MYGQRTVGQTYARVKNLDYGGTASTPQNAPKPAQNGPYDGIQHTNPPDCPAGAD
jgi:hypothetical protein